MSPWNRTSRPHRTPSDARILAIAVLIAASCFLLLARNAAAAAAPSGSLEAAHEYQSGMRLFEKGQYEAAAARFAKSTAQEPANSVYFQWLGRAYGLAAEKASLFSKPGLATLSREALQKAVTLDPNNIGARSDLAAYYHAAPSFMGGGREKARVQVEEIRKRDPYLGKIREGDLLQDEERLAESERAYAAAIALDSRRPEAHGRLGSLYEESGRYALAFGQWEMMLQADPGEVRALYGVGKTAASSGERPDEGEAALRKFLERYRFDPDGPSLAHGHFYLGVLAAKRKDVATARKEFDEALRLNRDFGEAAKARSSLPR